MSTKVQFLLYRLKSGEESAFDQFYNIYYVRLVNFAFSFVFDKSDAEDVVQGLFIDVWEKIEDINPKGSFESYLLKSVKNRCLNRIKRINIEDKHGILDLESTLNLELLDNSYQYEMRKKLRIAIDKLPKQIRKIILLKYYESKKVSEISEILSISLNTVKTQLQRGRTKLKVEFGTSGLILLFLSTFPI